MPSSSCLKTKTSYNHGCRCDDCKAAYKAWRLARLGPRFCKTCSVEIPRTAKRRYCSEACYPARCYGRDAVCPACGTAFVAYRRGNGYVVHCSRVCAQAFRVHRGPNDRRVKRRHRELAAPGLKDADRYRLLAKWVKQRRSCSYCPDLASTLDHVVPLIRGGTNFEGNLVPACRPCNSRKGWRLPIELRLGRSVRNWVPAYVVASTREARARVTVPVQLELKFPKHPRLAATHGSATFYQRGCRCEACWGWYCKSYAAKKRIGPQRARKASRGELLYRLGIGAGDAGSAGHPGGSSGTGVSAVDRLGAVADGVAGDGEGVARDLGFAARGDPRGGGRL